MVESLGREYEVVIGLEVHVQLLTKSKVFAADASSFGDDPNSAVSPITLGHPGTLPKLNKRAVEFAIRMGLACKCDIQKINFFDRKNYFYPDLPKGYQLTQDRAPICKRGAVWVNTKDGQKKVQLNRIHLEEDAGKSVHDREPDFTCVDLNRAGVPLIEIVTEPCISSAEEAGGFVTEVRKLARYLGISDGNMEEGSLRCDANVSVRPNGSDVLGKKVEIKNMNSIRNLQRAIDGEVARQLDIIKRGGKVVSETRTFDVNSGSTSPMRTKEELNDYRYFPDPDLSPVIINDEWLTGIIANMPELPEEKVHRYREVFGLPEYDARVLTDSREIAEYFEAVCAWTTHYKAASNWMMGPIKSVLNQREVPPAQLGIEPKTVADVIALVEEGKVSYTMASQRLFAEMLSAPGKTPLEMAQQLNLIQNSDEGTLSPIVDEVLKEFPLKVEEYKKGKKGIVSMFMGEVMKRSKGTADPKIASEMIIRKLNILS